VFVVHAYTSAYKGYLPCTLPFMTSTLQPTVPVLHSPAAEWPTPQASAAQSLAYWATTAAVKQA